MLNQNSNSESFQFLNSQKDISEQQSTAIINISQVNISPQCSEELNKATDLYAKKPTNNKKTLVQSKKKKIRKQKYNKIDLRSDTVTLPTRKMIQSIQNAVLGDDVFKDDPTVQKLQNYAAKLFGKEAALFVPTGCMGNSCGLMCHTQRGQELICSDDCHIIQQERAFVSQIAQLQSRTINTESTEGLLTPENVERLIRKRDFITEPKTGLIAIEQPTFTGLVYPLEKLRQIYEVAQKYNIPLHIDGARVFHAAAALNCEVKEIAQYCDSIQFCLSKGLCAPAGSMIVGKQDFIQKCIYIRKLLGGGMRQAGVLAAPALIALKKMRIFMKDDIKMSKQIGEQLKQIEGISLVRNIEINMVYFKINKEGVDNTKLVQFMDSNGIKMLGQNDDGIFRVITHHYIKEKQINEFIRVIKLFME